MPAHAVYEGAGGRHAQLRAVGESEVSDIVEILDYLEGAAVCPARHEFDVESEHALEVDEFELDPAIRRIHRNLPVAVETPRKGDLELEGVHFLKAAFNSGDALADVLERATNSRSAGESAEVGRSPIPLARATCRGCRGEESLFRDSGHGKSFSSAWS